MCFSWPPGKRSKISRRHKDHTCVATSQLRIELRISRAPPVPSLLNVLSLVCPRSAAQSVVAGAKHVTPSRGVIPPSCTTRLPRRTTIAGHRCLSRLHPLGRSAMQLASVFSGNALILYGEPGHQQWPDVTGDLMFLFAHSEDSPCMSSGAVRLQILRRPTRPLLLAEDFLVSISTLHRVVRTAVWCRALGHSKQTGCLLLGASLVTLEVTEL